MSIGGFIRRTFFWIKDFYRGGEFKKAYSEIIKQNFLNYDEKALNKKLLTLLEYACENTEFYK